jgi:LAO/AO transport system kinase
VLLCIQPGSGDSLQFMKAGVTELPDIVVVTKADMGDAARRARADVEGALTLYSEEQFRAPVVLVAAARGDGLDDLDAALAHHRAWLADGERLALRRAAQERMWIAQAIRARYGSAGLEASQSRMITRDDGPFTRERVLSRDLAARLLR